MQTFNDITFDQSIDASPVDLENDFAKILAFVYCSKHSVKVTKLLKLETIDGDIWCNSYIYKGAQDNIDNPIIKLSFTNHDSNMIFGY